MQNLFFAIVFSMAAGLGALQASDAATAPQKKTNCAKCCGTDADSCKDCCGDKCAKCKSCN